MAQSNPPLEHLYEMLKDFNHAMLVTRTPDGHMHARPMAVAELEKDADAYFVTDIESPKIAEIEAHPEVTLTFQSTSQFATLRGRVTVSRDRALIERLWSEAWKTWFPEGRNDPNLAVLKLDADYGELWDNSGMKGVKYGLEAMKAYAKGQRPETDRSQHARVDL